MKLSIYFCWFTLLRIVLEYPLFAQVHSNPEKSVLRTLDWRFSLPSSISDIPLPAGFERQYTSAGSYASYLQNLCLRSDTIIYLHNGQKKPNQSFGFMVVDLDVGEKNLQQCADAVIRLRSEYLFATKQFGGIHFNFSSGHTAYYTQWRQGYRAKITQKEVHWVKEADFDDSYQSFREYLDLVFNYAGSWSLERELSTISDIQDMQIGDVLIRGAFPGHVMLVVDMARHTESGEILFLLAQSARPAQDFHIVKNRSDLFLNPWYSLDALNTQLEIEEWTFYKDSLKRF